MTRHQAPACKFDHDDRLRSGDLATAAGVNVQTLRYYERRGLLDTPDRDIAGHRRYPAHTVTLLRMIKSAQALGFTLDEITDIRFAELESNALSVLSRRKVDELDSQIEKLKSARRVLASYID